MNLLEVLQVASSGYGTRVACACSGSDHRLGEFGFPNSTSPRFASNRLSPSSWVHAKFRSFSMFLLYPCCRVYLKVYIWKCTFYVVGFRHRHLYHHRHSRHHLQHIVFTSFRLELTTNSLRMKGHFQSF